MRHGMKFNQVSSTYFIQTLRTAQSYYKHIRQATTPWNEISQNDFSRYFLNKDGSAGFQEVRREANWTAGEPDVIFMERM